MSKIQTYINYIADPRARRSIRTMFTKLLNNDATSTHAAIVCGASATPISVAGAFTTGLEISADGTTGISITSGFSGVNMISLAGTGSTSGLLISGACAIPLNITGAFTTGLTIAADGTTAISVTSAFSGTTGLLFAGTATNGISLTGACATAAISISGAEAIGLSILTSTPTDGINIAAACANGIAIGGACTTAAIGITGAEAIGVLIATSTPTIGVSITAACATALSISGSNTTSAIAIGTAPLGISMTGSYTTAALQIGASGAMITLAAHDDHAIDVNTTCASTDGSNSVRPIHMISTMTGAGGVGGRAEFQTTISAALGGWANALKGYTDITTTTGSVSGLGSAVVSEMRLPGSALATGTYAVHEIELVTQASGSYTSPVSFIWCQVSGDGTATATFEDTGYLMTVKGLTEGTGNIYSAGADVAAAATLRILVGDTPYYILLGAGEST